MSPVLLGAVDFDSEEAWGSFQLIHGISHQSIQGAMLKQGLIPFYLPLLEFPRDDNAQYLLDHYQVHLSTTRLLGLAGVPDLATVDFDSEDQFYNWLRLHAAVHAAENAALGIV